MSTSLVVLVSYALLFSPAPSWIAVEEFCHQTSLSPDDSIVGVAAAGKELDFGRGGEQGDSVPTFPIRQKRPHKPDEACVDKTMRFEDVGGVRADRYYPPEERAERATVRLPRLASVDAKSAVLSIREGTHQLEIGGTADGWTLLETLSEPRPIAVLSRLFDHWGLVVYLAKDGPVAQIRIPVGRLECIREPDVRFPADYFARLIESQADILGNRVLEKHGEPSYENMLGFLAPLQAYTFLGATKSNVKRIVQPTGAIGMLPNRWGGDKPLAETLLDPREVLLSEWNQTDVATPPFEESRLSGETRVAGRPSAGDPFRVLRSRVLLWFPLGSTDGTGNLGNRLYETDRHFGTRPVSSHRVRRRKSRIAGKRQTIFRRALCLPPKVGRVLRPGNAAGGERSAREGMKFALRWPGR